VDESEEEKKEGGDQAASIGLRVCHAVVLSTEAVFSIDHSIPGGGCRNGMRYCAVVNDQAAIRMLTSSLLALSLCDLRRFFFPSDSSPRTSVVFPGRPSSPLSPAMSSAAVGDKRLREQSAAAGSSAAAEIPQPHHFHTGQNPMPGDDMSAALQDDASASPPSSAARLYRHALESIFSFCSLPALQTIPVSSASAYRPCHDT
jgi:hypothetical protein